MVVDEWVVYTENIFEVLQCLGRPRVVGRMYVPRSD